MESKGFDVVVVHSIDRLARDPYIRQTLERELGALGAVVEYATGNYEQTPEGEVRKDLEATFAKWENAKRVERAMRGKRRKAKQGLFVGSGRAPYGYKYDPEAKPGGLAIIEDQAELVRKIFELYINDNQSIRGITRILNEGNYPAPSMGRKKWQKSSISKILKNTAYIGRVYFDKWDCSGEDRKLRDKSEWIEIEIPAIIDQEVFSQAQKRLEHNRQVSKRKPKRVYLLSGMVFCADCGRPYVCQTALVGRDRRKVESKSYRHRIKEGHCYNKQISAQKLDPIVWDNVIDFLLDPQSIQAGYAQLIEQAEEDQKRQLVLKTEFINSLERLEQRRQNLIVAYTDPEIEFSKKDYIKQKEQIDLEALDVQERLEEIDSALANVPTPAEFESLERFATEIKTALIDGGGEYSTRQKRHILQVLDIRVFLDAEGNGRIETWTIPESIGFSSKSSSSCVPPQRQFPGRA